MINPFKSFLTHGPRLLAVQEVLGVSLPVTVVPQEVNLLTSMFHSGPTYCAFFIKGAVS